MAKRNEEAPREKAWMEDFREDDPFVQQILETVPLTGFGYSLAKGVAKAVAEEGALGVLTGGLTATAGGIAAAVVFGLLMALLFKPKEKR